jgi:hypothetical protein
MKTGSRFCRQPLDSFQSYKTIILQHLIKPFTSKFFYAEKAIILELEIFHLDFILAQNITWSCKIDKPRVYAQNPFTSFKYNGFSPELGNQSLESSVDNNAYPLTAILYSSGVNFKFLIKWKNNFYTSLSISL